jgi:uncharacterized protein YjbI with pentapeptide repeats
MNKLSCFLARIGHNVRLEMPVSFFRRVAGVLFFLAVLVGLVVAVQIVPEWQVKRASVRSAAVNPEAKTTPADIVTLQNELRKTLIQVVGGAFALFALYLTFRRVKVAEQGHITDRYTKAIEQLGALTAENKPNVEVRLGAIYALERTAQDSSRDHWTIMEVLTAYVRQNAAAPEQVPTKEENEKAIAKGPATEIKAILTVLGRRRKDRGREQEGQFLDLSQSDLRGADLTESDVVGASFERAHLEGSFFQWAHVGEACFDNAHVEGARFDGAHLENATFRVAHLEGAEFYAADVEGAHFSEAHLTGVTFDEAHIEGVWFYKADLRGASFNKANMDGARFGGAIGLTVEQVMSAKGWEQAEFDEAFLRELKLAKERLQF